MLHRQYITILIFEIEACIKKLILQFSTYQPVAVNEIYKYSLDEETEAQEFLKVVQD